MKQLRESRKLTQERLAELAEIHPRALQKIEAGHVDVSLTTIIKLRKALGQEWQILLSSLD